MSTQVIIHNKISAQIIFGFSIPCIPPAEKESITLNINALVK